jgi:uncharacterized protein YggE
MVNHIKEKNMKKKWLVAMVPVLALLLALPVLTGCQGSPVSSGDIAAVQVSQQPEGFWVSGTGEVTVTPDLATVILSIQSQEDTVAAARTVAAEGMSKLMASLADSGIADKDIQSSGFNISQRTRWNDYTSTQTVIGYQVTNTVTVKIRNVDNVGDVIDAVVQAGGDLVRISDLTFSVEDPSVYYEEARQKAIADAKDKAEQYAALLGVTLGEPTYVAEGSMTSNIYSSYSSYSLPAPTIVEYSLAGTSFSSGENTVTLNVTVAYDIKR